MEGYTGLPNTFGDTGTIGTIGSLGAKGPLGAKGDTGIQGIIGTMAMIGQFGPTGHFGTTGGIGTTAEIGCFGPNGIFGEIGITGYEGMISMLGEIGCFGHDGTMGVNGCYGHNGPVGYYGVTGTEGPFGITGYIGSTGNTGSEVAGPTGSDSKIGPRGSTGPIGPSPIISSLVFIGAFTGSGSFQNIFSSKYTNYRVVISYSQNENNTTWVCTFLNGAVSDTSNTYTYWSVNYNGVLSYGLQNTNYFSFGSGPLVPGWNNGTNFGGTFDIFNPYENTRTTLCGYLSATRISGQTYFRWVVGSNSQLKSFDGIKIAFGTSFIKYCIYGYKK